MKIFRKLFLIVPILFSLASCNGNNSPAGTYTFQLGSDNGTHAGIGLMLTDDPVQTEASAEAKRFELKFDLGASKTNGVFGLITHFSDVLEYVKELLDDKLPIPESIDDIIKWISEKEEDVDPTSDVTVNGYYYVKSVVNSENKKENRLMMGFDFNFLEEVDLPPELVEMIMYAVYTGDSVNIVVPVSVEDLLFQLYWYGYRIGGLEAPTYLPDENPALFANDIGSHPVENKDNPDRDPVTIIQKYQAMREDKAAKGEITNYGPLEFIYNSYHDYHTLTMGLAKNGK